MKTIYIDSEYMCHLENADGRTEVQTDAFDGVVDGAIPYYRYIPQGEEYINSKGRTIYGLFIQATDSEAIIRITTQSIMDDMTNALAVLGVSE